MQVVLRRSQRGPPPQQSESDPPEALHALTCTAVQCEDCFSVRFPTCIHVHVHMSQLEHNYIHSCPAGINGSDLPVCGGRVPAHQLLQLQLLALCGSVCGRPHLPAHHSARPTPTCEGAAFFFVHITLNIITWNKVHTHTQYYKLLWVFQIFLWFYFCNNLESLTRK